MRRRRLPLSLVAAEVAACAWRESQREAAWLAGCLSMLPYHWGRYVGAEHVRRGGLACAEANRWLLGVTESAGGRVPVAASDGDVLSLAAEHRQACADLSMVARAGSVGWVYERLCGYCRRVGVVPPCPKNGVDLLPCVRRMLCGRWWVRTLRRAVARRCEGLAVRAGVVRRGLWPYVSQDQVERERGQNARAARAIDGATLVDLDSAEVVALRDVVDRSVASPSIRRGEMMTRIRGADEWAADAGDRCEFWTLTCPSKFHAQRTVYQSVSEPNAAYGGASPKEAHAYLSAVWARARAAWKRRGLGIYGLRTAEPHHDGCPHWHIVVYGSARDLRYARRLLRVYALREDGGERGALQHRFTCLPLVGGHGGASYAAKYIAKNIDGGPVGDDLDGETGRKIVDTAERVRAWAKAWGIRQFQFFGMPPVGVWRCLRRFSGEIGPERSPLERARRAADDGDWRGYWAAWRGGGIVLLREQARRLTVYGDAAVAAVVGVGAGGARAELDRRAWVVAWSGRAVASLLEGAKNRSFVSSGLGFDLPWSGVNNCTGAA